MPEKDIFETALTDVKTSTQGDVEGVGVLRWSSNYLYRWVQNSESSALVAAQPVCHDASVGAANLFNTVVAAATGIAEDIAFFAGIAMAAIPASGYGWILVDGIYEEALVDEPGTTAIAVGEILVPSATLDYLGRAVALGTAATYPRHAVAMEAVATTTPATASTTTIRVLVKAF